MSSEQIVRKVQEQFGRSAESYVTSTVHAHGSGLAELVALTQPQAQWHVLDVATGGGHCAFAFAPHVAQVIASDITTAMLEVARQEGARRDLHNIVYQYAPASELPFPPSSFDLVTCRVAAHHFPDNFAFLQSAERVLKSGGLIAIEDNTVPDGKAGDYINAYETLRDPSHVRCLSVNEWEEQLFAAGFALEHKATSLMKIPDFFDWAERMHVSADDQVRLQLLLLKAPPEVTAVFQPIVQGQKIAFHLERTLLVGRKIG